MERTRNVIRPPNPRKEAGILSVMTFAYTIPTFLKGFRKGFREDDITQHLEVHDSKILGDRLEEAWMREQSLHQEPSFWRAIRRVFGLEYMLLSLALIFVEIMIKISQTLALAQLLSYYDRNDSSITGEGAYMYAGFIVGASFLNVVTGHAYMMQLQHFGMKLRVACCSVVYRKSLRLSKAALEGTTIGQMVNLLSNDVSRCDYGVIHANTLWICPMETLIIFGILYNMLGITAATGIFFMVMFVPLQMYMGKKTSEFRLKTATETDERVRLMNEIISGIQIIKMYTWEKPFAELVAIARRLEIRHIRAASYVRGLIISFAVFTTRFAIFLAILAFVLLGNTPKAEHVFIVTSFYNILRLTLTRNFAKAMTEIAELNVSVNRIQRFLLCGETKVSHQTRKTYLFSAGINKTKENVSDVQRSTEADVDNCTGKFAVQLENASAKWSSSSTDNTLSDINFLAQRDQLVAIIGPVGSGKTSLLHVILKELPLKSGTLNVNGKISYASQEPWVFAGTIQQNILFGQPMQPERYEEVVRVCALQYDFHLFPYGDKTLVGERGATLSGGQRARVNLARAVYKEADIYLLDDPLSAVDTQVGKQLFEECITKFLNSKCTILVTHHLQCLRNVSQVLLVENGRIVADGTYQKLQESQVDFLKCSGKGSEENASIDKDSGLSRDFSKNKEASVEIKEHSSSGKIASGVYLSYFKAGGSLFAGFGVLLLFVATQLAGSATDFFLTYWVNLEQVKSYSNCTTPCEGASDLSRNFCICIYSAIVASIVILSLTRSFSFFKYCMAASTRLHDSMFSNIVCAPMKFFNTRSSGGILNRFSKDMGAIDEILPLTAVDCFQIGFTVLGVTIVVALVNPWLLIVTAIILTIFYLLRFVYLATSRSLKRLESITRSPVFAHMNASLQGLTTIRAFGAQSVLEEEFDNHQDLHSSVSYLFLSCTRAFGFWLDLVCVGYIAAVTFSFFIMENTQYGGNVGLAVTQAISLTGMLQWGMRQWSELENQMTAVERVEEYTKIEREANRAHVAPPPSWPESASINFVSVSLRYSPTDPYVLKHLNFSISPNEKIGIVGRTGAGKSSLICALFQLAETEGSIFIDNVDVTKVPLQTLRSKISIIPQEPVLFSGTVRKNLDPFEQYSDADLWNALEEVELKNVLLDSSEGLNLKVSEGGSNFSVGQRQLLCLARAIIRKNKILVLDEATANVDPQTDKLVQNTIRSKFAYCTVLTVAHRLHTIMDSDKVLVMDAGHVVEFDHPYVLGRNEHGVFYSMVQQTGHSMAQNLLEVAENSYRKKSGSRAENFT